MLRVGNISLQRIVSALNTLGQGMDNLTPENPEAGDEAIHNQNVPQPRWSGMETLTLTTRDLLIMDAVEWVLKECH